MNKIRQYNKLKNDAFPLTYQKEAIKRYWKDRFVGFVSTDGKYISFLVRI